MLTFVLCLIEDHPMGERKVEKDIEWHVGQNPPSEYLDDARLEVMSVMADGAELTHIIQTFTNLPYARHRPGRSCVWRGELARFIFDNL